jgi:two-component system, OmpR family, alkaline phosphatase synthesis response regulator PhoP
VGQRILIVDDEPNIAASLEFLLQRGGYDVKVAHNGEEALVQAESFRPQLVLLDVMMPKLNGYEVCQRLRQGENGAHVKIVMLTARGREVDVEKGRALGADLYVTKPFSTRELVDRVRELLATQPQA